MLRLERFENSWRVESFDKQTGHVSFWLEASEEALIELQKEIQSKIMKWEK